MSVVICGFYGTDTEHLVPPLVRTLRAYQHTIDFIKIDGDATKPELILQAMRRHPRKIIVVLDPDCMVHAPLNQLRHIRGDVALLCAVCLVAVARGTLCAAAPWSSGLAVVRKGSFSSGLN
jgi:hypothetical protein